MTWLFRRLRSFILPFCAAACFAVFALNASEQRGVVKFNGLPLPGATVTATLGDQKFVAVTDPQGAYSFANLPDGAWTVQVEMLCFSTIKREVNVASGAPAEEWELKLLPLTEMNAQVSAVGLTAAAPATAEAKPSAAQPQAQADNTKPGFRRADVNASPGAAAPGNAGNTPAQSSNEAATQAPSEVNQAPSDGFLINGSVNNGAASPFAQSAAFGNYRRGQRSLYNGNLGITEGSSVLDARSFSMTGQDIPKPGYNHFQGMASFGGPLKIPHLIRGNGAPNITINYQWMRNRNASTQSTLMPTLAQRNGDFSSLPAPILDPTNGQPFPGNVIPTNRISPQAEALLKYYPLPNFNASRYNYQTPIVGVTDQDSLQTRINKSINAKNQIYGNFAFQHTDTKNPNVFGFPDDTNSLGLIAAANYSHRFNQHLFAHVQYQFSRYSAIVTPYFANRENVSGEAGITGNNQDPVNWGPPALNFSSGVAGLSDGNSSVVHNQTNSLSVDSMWNKGRHNVTYGADFRKLEFNLISQQNPRGSFTFTGASTGAIQGSDFAGFLLGIPDTSSIAYGNADKYFRSSSYDAYITDDFRVGPSLTVNAGIRWEYSSPITELYGRLVNLDIAPGFAAVAPVVANNPSGSLTGQTYPDSLVHPDKHGFQPRIGVSWRPFLASSLIIRAGYGVNYNTSVYQSIATQMAQQAPLSKSLSVPNSATNPLTLANGFIASSTVTQNTFAIDPNFRIGYAQNWNLIVQRDLPGGMVMTATYNGIKGTRAQQEFLPNTFPTGAVNPCSLCPSGFAYMTSNGNSTRESGQFQLRRRLHNGITATLQYTYSKSMDDAALGGRNQGGSVIAQNWLNLSAERGLSNFDQRHLLNLTAQYSTGVGMGGGTLMSGWRGTAFKDWTFLTQINAGSGLPQTPVYFRPVNGTGVTGSIRPDYTGASLYDAPAGFFLNPAAYTTPAAGDWGNAGRNSITGPMQFSLNASVGRTFRVNDRVSADFRIDSNNALNHVTWTSWVVTTASSQFGLPSGASGMRTLQATMRFRF